MSAKHVNEYLSKHEKSIIAGEDGERELEQALLHDMESLWRTMSDTDRLYVLDELKHERGSSWAVAGLLAVVIICLAFVFWPAFVKAAYEEVPCSSALPQPPLTVILPDGQVVPATRLVYTLDSRTIEVIGSARLFCSGFE